MMSQQQQAAPPDAATDPASAAPQDIAAETAEDAPSSQTPPDTPADGESGSTSDGGSAHDPGDATDGSADDSGHDTGGDDANAPADGAGEPCDDWPLATRIEALLLTSDRPLSTGRLGELLGIESKGQARRIKEAIAELNEAYEQTGRSFRVEQIAGGWQFYTVESLGPLMTRLHTQRQSSRLSQAAMETLSIIAYRQPILRAEIEAIRGVACGEVLRGLMERRLVKIVGRAEELGRPMLYGTTRQFLEVFGLSDLDDLPPVEGLSPGRRPESSEPETDTTSAENAEAADENADNSADATGEPAPSDETADDSRPSEAGG